MANNAFKVDNGLVVSGTGNTQFYQDVNAYANLNVTGTDLKLSATTKININGSIGTDGQVLTTDGVNGVYWNAAGAGPRGYTGSQGILGYTGSIGPAGAGYTGSFGYTGSVGYTGSQGTTGSQGVIGYTGSQGVIGYTGSAGTNGYNGSVGFTGSKGTDASGFTGSQGYTGSAGTNGANGFTGSQGIQGVIGYTGSQGYTGSAGTNGTNGFTGSQGTTGSQGVIGYTGSQGTTGSQGVIGYTGSQGPTGSQGVIGYTGSGYGITASVQMGSLGVGTAASGTSGEIRATNNITAYYSDRRLKENIVAIDNALNKVNSISGVYYNSNDVAEKYGYDDRSQQVGVIAQELEAIMPHVVKAAPFDTDYHSNGMQFSVSGEHYKTVQYERIIPLLIEAIKELTSRVEKLEAR